MNAIGPCNQPSLNISANLMIFIGLAVTTADRRQRGVPGYRSPECRLVFLSLLAEVSRIIKLIAITERAAKAGVIRLITLIVKGGGIR